MNPLYWKMQNISVYAKLLIIFATASRHLFVKSTTMYKFLATQLTDWSLWYENIPSLWYGSKSAY